MMAAAVASMVMGPACRAEVLRFENATCSSGMTCTLSAGIDQTFGDIPGQLDVTYTSRSAAGNSQAAYNYLRWWGGGYSDLASVVWGGSSDSNSVGEIALIPAPGYQVTLNAFDLGSYIGPNLPSRYTVYDSNYAALNSSAALSIDRGTHSHFTFSLTNSGGLIIQWGPSAFNVGINNVDFTVSPIQTGTPASSTSTGSVLLDHAKIKTVASDALQPANITLPTCPAKAELFSQTTLTCPASAPSCSIEAKVTSELRNITPRYDSVRFYFTIDGAARRVFPNTNFGTQSTAKAGRTETGAASWMANRVTPGPHTLEVKGCVANTSAGNGASAIAGNRILLMNLYRNN